MATLQQKLEIIIDAQNKTGGTLSGVSKDLDKFKGKVESMQPAFQKMALAGTVALGAISALAIKSIRDYGEAEKAVKQLEYATMKISGATREQFEATNALADALERKGVLDGDNIRTGLAQLSTFGLTNEAVRALGQSMADLAVNQYGVEASGAQLEDTANMMAKALRGEFGMLEKSGIRFTEAQKKIIEYGTEMEKVAAINEGFQQNLKYTNDVALTTFEGKLAKVKVQVGNLSEGIGKALLPAVEKILAAVAPVVEKFVAWAEQNPELLAKIVMVAAGIAALVAVIGTLGLVLPAIISTIQTLIAVGTVLIGVVGAITAPVWLVIAAIAALIAIGVLLYQNWDTVKAYATSTFQAIHDYIASTMTAIGEAIMTAIYFIVGLFAMFMDLVFPGWQAGLTALWTAWLETWEGIKIYFQAVIAWIREQFTALAGVFKTIWAGIVAVFQWAKDQIKIVLDWISSAIQPIFDLIDKLKKKLDSVGSAVKGALGSVIQKGKDVLGARAQGGPVSSGLPYMVGENGPEVFTPATAGRITPNGVGGQTIVIQLSGNTFMGREGVAKQIADDIMRQLSFRTKLA